MEVKKARKLIRKIILENEATEVGIFISMLSFQFIQACGITQDEFISSLKNSLKIIGGTQDERNRKVDEHKED